MKSLLVFSLAWIVACGGDAATKTGAANADAGPADARPAEGATGPVDLPKVGLKGDAPAGSAAGDAVGGGVGHLVQGPGLLATVEVAPETRARTIEDARKEAAMYNPQHLKDEALADGWALTFDNEGGAGKSYFVQVRREIAGKSIWCETTATTPEQSAAALAFCRSLRP